MHRLRLIGFVLCAGICAGFQACAEPPARDADAVAIRAAAKAYVEALKAGDTKTLTGLWTSDGDIVDDLGQVLLGRETVAVPVATQQSENRPEFRITETSLRFLTDDVAIEDGQVEVQIPGTGSPLEGRFTATWVRDAGGWKIAALREARDPAPTGPELLRELDWMVGEWQAVDETTSDSAAAAVKPAAEMTMSVRWNDAHTYLLREMRIRPTHGGEKAGGLEISQRIGWDPLSRRIRSWAFSSDGSHSEATWERDSGSWVAHTASVRPDGSQTAAINAYTYDGKDRCTVRSLHTHVGGEHLPPVALTLVRTSKGQTP
jgi:uncharacterized protein (TIGR02246 family)